MKKIGNSPLSELISFAEDELTHNVKSSQRRKVVLKESPADDEWQFTLSPKKTNVSDDDFMNKLRARVQQEMNEDIFTSPQTSSAIKRDKSPERTHVPVREDRKSPVTTNFSSPIQRNTSGNAGSPGITLSSLGLSPYSISGSPLSGKGNSVSMITMEKDYNSLKGNLEKLEEKLRSSQLRLVKTSRIPTSKILSVKDPEAQRELRKANEVINELLKENENLKDAELSCRYLRNEVDSLREKFEDKIREVQNGSSIVMNSVEDKYQSVVQEVSLLKEKNAKLEEVVLDTKRNRSAFDGRIKDLEDQNRTLMNENRTLKNILQEDQMHAEQNAQKIHDLSLNTKELSHELEVLRNQSRELTILKNTYGPDLSKNYNGIRELYETSQVEIHELFENNSELKKQVESLKTQNKDSTFYASSLERINAELNAKVKILSEQIQDYEDSRKKLQNEHNRLFGMIESEVEKSTSRLEEHKNNWEEENNVLKAELDKNRYEMEALEKKNRDLQAKLSSIDIERRMNGEEINSSKKELKETSLTLKQTKEKLRELVTENMNIKYELKQKKDLIDKLQRECAEYKEARLNLEAEWISSQSSNELLKTSIEEKHYQLSKLSDKVAEMQQKLTDYKAQESIYEDRGQTLQQLSTKLDNVIQERDDLDTRLAFAEEANEKLKIEIKVATTKLADLERTKVDLNESKIEAELDNMSLQLNNAKNENVELKKQNEQHETHIKYLEKEKTKLNSKNNEATAKIRQLIQQNQTLLEKSLIIDAKDEHIDELKNKLLVISEEKDHWKRKASDVESVNKAMNDKVKYLQANIERDQATIEDHLSKIRDFELKTEELEKELEEIMSESGQLQKQITLLEQQKSLLETDVDAAKHANNKLILELSDSKAEYERLIHEMEKYKQQSLIEGMSELKQIDQLRLEVEQLRQERQKLKQDRSKWESACKRETEEKSAIEKTAGLLDNEVKVLKKQSESLQEQIKDLQRDNIELHNQALIAKENGKSDSELKRTIESLEQEIRDLENENHSLNLSLTLAHQKLDSIGQTKDDIEQKAVYNQTRLTSRLEKLENDLKLTLTEKEELNRKLIFSTNEIQQLEAERIKLTEKLATSESQKMDLSRLAVEEKQAVNESFSERIEDSKLETSTLLVEVGNLTSELNRSIVEKDELAKQKRELESQIRVLQKERDSLEVELKLSKKHQESLILRVEEDEEIRKNQATTIQRSMDAVRETQLRKEDVDSQNRLLTKQIASMNQEMEVLRESFDKERQIYLNKISSLENGLVTKSHEVDDVRIERDNLHNSTFVLEENTKEYKIQAEAARQEVKNLRKSNEQIQSHLSNSEARVRKLIAEKEELLLQIEAKADELNACLDKIKTLVKEDSAKEELIIKIKEENATLKSLIATIKTDKLNTSQILSKMETKKLDQTQRTYESRVYTLEKELELRNLRVSELERQLADVGKDLMHIRADTTSSPPREASSPVPTELGAIRKYVSELTEKNHLLSIQIEKLQEKIKNKDSLLQSMEKNLQSEKSRLHHGHATVVNTLKSASKNTKELLEYERKKFKFAISLMNTQIDECKRFIEESEKRETESFRSIALHLESAVDARELNSFKDEYGIIHNEAIRLNEEGYSATRFIVEKVQGQQKIARDLNQLRLNQLDYIAQVNDLKNQHAIVEEKMGINDRKTKHLKIIHSHLAKSVNEIVSDLELLVEMIESGKYNSGEIADHLQQFEKLLHSLEFRLQFLHKAERIDKLLYERIVKIEKINSQFAKRYNRQKDYKLERYYQYIGETLLEQQEEGSQPDRESFKVQLAKLIHNLEKRTSELASKRDLLHKERIDLEKAITEDSEAEDKQRLEMDHLEREVVSEQKRLLTLQSGMGKLAERRALFNSKFLRIVASRLLNDDGRNYRSSVTRVN